MYFRNTKVYFQSTKVYSRSTKVYSPSTKVYFQSTSILSNYTSILSKNKSLLWKYKSILWRKNPKTRLLRVLFDSIDLLALFGVYAGIIFSQFVFVQSLAPTHFFSPRKKNCGGKKNGGDFISFLCEGPLHKNISMLCRWGLTGGSNDAPGVSAFFFLKFGRETLFHCFT